MTDVARPDETYDPAHPPNPHRWLELDEDARMGLIVEYHKRAGIHVANDRLHAAMHLVVENQLAIGERVVVDTAARLRGEGLVRHDTIHALGSVLIDRLVEVMRGATKATKEELARKYLDDLAALTAERWQNER